MKRCLVVVGVMTLAALAACGSSASSSGSGGTIKIEQIAPYESEVTSLPYMKTSLQAAVDQINAGGGVNGRKLELVGCNSQEDPNKELTCAQQAAQDQDVVAVVGSLLFSPAQALKVLEQAKLPSIGADLITPGDGQSPASFLLDPGLVAYSAMPIVAKEKLGATKIVEFNIENPVVGTNNKFFDQGAKVAGVDVVDRITVPTDAIDYTQYVAQAEKAGAQVIVSAAAPQSNQRLWQALATTGSKIKTVMSSGSVTQDIVDQVGPVADGNWLVQGTPNASTDNPYGTAFVDAMKKYQPDEKVFSGVGLRAYYAGLLLENVLKNAGDEPTRANVWNDFNKVSGLKFAWIDDLDYTKDGPFASTPRVVTTQSFALSINKGKIEAAGQISLTN